jgi:hypothetical protein
MRLGSSLFPILLVLRFPSVSTKDRKIRKVVNNQDRKLSTIDLVFRGGPRLVPTQGLHAGKVSITCT